VSNDALILPHGANLPRTGFSGMTGAKAWLAADPQLRSRCAAAARKLAVDNSPRRSSDGKLYSFIEGFCSRRAAVWQTYPSDFSEARAGSTVVVNGVRLVAAILREDIQAAKAAIMAIKAGHIAIA
jgi:hypothetical protein